MLWIKRFACTGSVIPKSCFTILSSQFSLVYNEYKYEYNHLLQRMFSKEWVLLIHPTSAQRIMYRTG